jgi:hypothetical protein
MRHIAPLQAPESPSVSVFDPVANLFLQIVIIFSGQIL